MKVDYTKVTELSGDEVSQEQVKRICNRYYWAGNYCRNKDVIEAACGTGQGLGYLSKIAKTIVAGDYSEIILKIAKSHYGERITFFKFDAQDMPFPDNSIDIILLFEAIYYLPSPERFVAECRRVLRDGGKVLIATANKDLFDFSPSPYSYKYFGVSELHELFNQYGFTNDFFGGTPIDKLSVRQKIFRPIKKLAVHLGLVPKTMDGKKFLKRLIFGRLVKMPPEIEEGMFPYDEPVKLKDLHPDRKHKVIYCAATLYKTNTFHGSNYE